MNNNNAPNPTNKGSILIVDDTRENLRLLVDMLADQGYQVRAATSGAWALSAIYASPPDLILLDIMMPDMDGYAVCETLKADEHTHDIPIIFISALHEVFDKVKAFSMGGVDYITKPFQVEEVVARVQNHMTLRALHRQLQEQNVVLKQEIRERTRIETHLTRLNRQMQDELIMARQIQRNLLPPPEPVWPGLDVSCYSLPAHHVGGDMYTYHAYQRATDQYAGRHFIVAVGDVSGKGMPAALLMAASLASFRSMIGRVLGPAAFLRKMDHAVGEHTRMVRQNCAMVYVEFLLSKPKSELNAEANHAQAAQAAPAAYATMTAANAGCIEPVIKRSNGQVEWVDVGGIPLGVGLGAAYGYEELRLDLYEGDMVVLISDGVLEARNAAGEMFGFERLDEAILSGPQTSADALLHHIRSAVETFSGATEEQDDVTIVVVRLRGAER